MTTYSIAELWRYPVKSMGGERVESLELRTSAVVGDRRWAVRSIETEKIASADLAWKDLDVKIGDAKLRIGDATPRCVMTTLLAGSVPDQASWRSQRPTTL